MLPAVTIRKGGVLTAPHKRQPREVSDIILALNSSCEVEEGATLRDVFLITRNWASYLSPILTNSTEWLEQIIDEGLSETPFEEDAQKLTSVRLSWKCSVCKSYDKNDSTPTLDLGTDFIGVGPVPDSEDYQDYPEDHVTYAIEMTPTYKLVDLPFELDTKFDIRDERISFDPNIPPMASVSREFTLYEVLFGVFWELSFFGGPESRDDQREELKKSLDRALSSDAKTVPWEEVKKRLKEGLDEES